MSQFVTEALRKELTARKEVLEKEFREANEDAGQLDALHEWDVTSSDGIGSSNEW